MAVIKCKECKKEVSSSAKVCPHCGVKNPGMGPLEILIGLAVLAIICAVIYYLFGSTESNKTNSTVTTEATEEISKPAAKEFKYASKTLKEYRNEPQYERKEIVEDYVSYKDISETETDNFYSCLSQISYTKSGDLKLGDVLGWCYTDYTQDPKSLTNHINFDEFMSKFSGWDGSYRPLEKIIKENMHDESTYKHVETTYRLILDKNPHAVIETTFRGSNAYGGIVKQTISANVDIKTGQIIDIISK
ncbi:hypothetical protein [Photorhabdus asymbiotica]|uniref:hypothetical protein n=1 Tax=Photorhabdus asymbiotica TaxID=291112 RepID=UPI003DA6F9F9